jgi:hypothetical protein
LHALVGAGLQSAWGETAESAAAAREAGASGPFARRPTASTTAGAALYAGAGGTRTSESTPKAATATEAPTAKGSAHRGTTHWRAARPAFQLSQPLFGPHERLLGLLHRLLQIVDLGAGPFDLVVPGAFAASGPLTRGVLIFLPFARNGRSRRLRRPRRVVVRPAGREHQRHQAGAEAGDQAQPRQPARHARRSHDHGNSPS